MGLFGGIVDTLKNEKNFLSEASKGDKDFKNHQYSSAKNHYDKALVFKKDTSVLEKKLICDYYLKNYNEVVKNNFDSNNLDFKLAKAKSYFYLKNCDKALNNVNDVIESDEFNNDALLLKGSILFNQNNDYAINFFKRCREEFSDDFNFNLKCFIDYMYCLVSLNNYVDSIRISNLILTKSKDNIDALIVKGLSFYNNELYSKALELFDKTYSLYANKKLDKYLDKYIDCIVNDKSLSPDEIYEKISKLSDDNKFVFKYKALTSNFFKTSKDQLNYINSILDDFKEDEDILLKKANLCYELGLMDESLNSLNKLNSKNAILLKIKVLYGLEKYEDILNIYESSKNIIDDLNSLFLIAESLFELKKYNKAKNIYDELLKNKFSFDLKNYIDCVLILASECDDLNDSINYFNEILNVDETNMLVLTLLYKSYLEQKEYEKSLDVINKILEIEKSDDVIADKIFVLNCLEKYDEASNLLNKVSGVDINLKFNLLTKLKEYEEAFKFINEVDETNEDVLISKVDVYFHLKHYSEVLNIIDVALKTNNDNINLLLFKSHSLCGLEKYNESILVYNSILKIHDENVEALKGKAYCLFKLNKYYDALDIYDELIELDNDINILEKRALSLYNIDEKLEALDDFEKVVNSDKSKINKFKTEYINSLIFMGNNKNKENSFNEAIKYFDKVLAIDLKNTDAFYGKLYSYYNLNDDNQIINICDEILKLKMDEEILSKKAVSLLNIGDYINSINCFEELFNINNNKLNDYFDEYTTALRNYAMNKYNDKKYDVALKYLDKYLLYIPDEEMGYYKADCYYKLGDLDNSIKCYETLDINKYKSQYIEVLYDKSLEVDNSEKLNLLNLILKFDKNNLNALILKSKTLFDLKKYDESIDCCKIILNKDSTDFEILKIYAKSLFNLDDYEKAYECFLNLDDDESKEFLKKSRKNIIENLLEKSKNYYYLKKWDELIKISDKILTYDSLNYNALLNKSKALFNLNQFSQAYDIFKSFNLNNLEDYKEEYLKTLKELGFKSNDLGYLNEYLNIEFNFNVLLKRSEIFYQSGNYDKAIEDYETLLQKDNSKLDLFKDKYIELLLNKAKNYCDSSKYNQSIISLDKILELDNQDEKALIYKANCLFKLKNYKDTLLISNQILEIGDNKDILFLKAESLYQLKKYLESIKCFNQLNNEKFNDKKEIVIKSFVKEYKKKIKDCDEHKILESLENILPHIPKNYELLKIKSDTLYKLEKYEECIEVSKTCLDIKKTSNIVENILNSLFNLEKYNDFIELYETLSYKSLKNKFKNTYLKALTNVGLKLFNDKDFEKAIDYFNKLINIEYDEIILNSLAFSYYNLNKYLDAVKNWDILLSNNSSIELYKKEYIDSIWHIIDENPDENYLNNLNKILNLDENNVDALIKKANLLVLNSKFKQAFVLYEKLNSIDNDVFNQYEENYLITLKELGLKDYNNKSYENALNYFIKFLEITENQNIRFLKADCHYKLNQLDESILNYQLISDIDEYKSNYIAVLYTKALESDLEDKIKYCDLILDLENNNINALILKSKSLFELKEYNDVKNICLDILNIDENNYEIIVIYAKSLFKLKDYENAFIQFEKALAINPLPDSIDCLEKTREIIVNNILDQLKENIDDGEKLLKLSNKLLKYDANNYEGLLNKAKALFNLNKYMDAILIFRQLNHDKISDFKHEYSESLKTMISFECSSNNFSKVLEYCNEFLNINNDINILIKKAEALYYQNQNSDAIEIYMEILNEDPSKIDTFKNHYINSLIQMGNYYSSEIFNFKKAIDYWDEILKYDKNNIEVLINKTKDLCKLKKYWEVINCCDEILNIDENNIEILLIKSKLLFNSGHYDEVITTCDHIIENEENCFKAWKLKSKSLYELNNYSDAIDVINKTLKIKFDLELENFKENLINKYIEDYLNEIDDTSDWELILKSLDSKLEFIPYCMDLLELKAEALFNLQKYQLALECYNIFLLFNFDVNSMLNKLYCLFNLDNKKDFIKLFDELKVYNDNIDKKLVDYYYNSMRSIIFSLFDAGEFDNVLVYVNNLLEEFDDMDLMILKANTLFMKNEYLPALDEYELILNSDYSKLNEFKDNYVECLFVKIELLIKQNKCSQSLILIDKILNIYPDNEKALNLKSDSLISLIYENYQNNDFKTSLNLIDDYLEFRQNDEILILKGKILNHLERFKEAIEIFESIKSNFDEYKLDYYSALESFVKTQVLDDDELLIYYEKMLNIFKKDIILIKKANILLKKDLLIESKNCLDDLDNIFDNYDDYLNLILALAIRFKDIDDYNNSLDLFNNVLSYDNDNVDALSNCIEIYFNQEDYNSILKFGYHLLEINKTTLKDLYYFTISCYMQGEYTSAYSISQLILDNEYFEDIKNIQDKSKEAIIKNLNDDAKEFIKNEFYVSALNCYNEILSYDNLNQNALLDKSSLLMLIKRYDEAVECYKVILDINPNKFLILSLLSLLNLESKPFLVFDEYLNWLNKGIINKKDCESELENALNQLDDIQREACEKILNYIDEFKITSFSISFEDLIKKYLILFNQKYDAYGDVNLNYNQKEIEKNISLDYEEKEFENLILEYAVKGD